MSESLFSSCLAVCFYPCLAQLEFPQAWTAGEAFRTEDSLATSHSPAFLGMWVFSEDALIAETPS